MRGHDDAERPSMLPWYAFGFVSFPLAAIAALLTWPKVHPGMLADVSDKDALALCLYEIGYARRIRNRRLLTSAIGAGFFIVVLVLAAMARSAM